MLSSFLGAVLVAASLPAFLDDPAGWSIEAVTTSGVKYTGVVLRTERTAEWFDADKTVDPGRLPATERIDMKWFNGLSGSIGLRFGDLRSVQKLASMTSEDLRERGEGRTQSNAAKWVKERARLAVIANGRANRAVEAAEAAERAAEEAAAALDADLTDDQRTWLEAFPPDGGWIPARKTQLYHQSTILNNKPLTDSEQEWLDSYDQWKPAYDLWFQAETKKIAAEEAAAVADELLPPNQRPEPSGTARSAAAAIDPDAPTKEEASQRPPPIGDTAPTPTKIAKEVPRPVPLTGVGGGG